MKKHRFWAWAGVVCMMMAMLTGYKRKNTKQKKRGFYTFHKLQHNPNTKKTQSFFIQLCKKIFKNAHFIRK